MLLEQAFANSFYVMRKTYLESFNSPSIDLHLAQKIREPNTKLTVARLLYIEKTRGFFAENPEAINLEDYFCENKKFKALDVLEKGDLVLLNTAEKVFRLLATSDNSPTSQKDLAINYKWDVFLKNIRKFFQEKDFCEVRSPYLVDCSGIERHIDPFISQWNGKAKYLPTSPELHLKKLLVNGMRDIYEIKTCFRQEDLSPMHQPEFMMLEWYRAYADLDYIKEDIKELINCIFKKKMDITIVSVKDLFKNHVNFLLNPDTTLSDLQKLCREQNIYFSSQEEWNDIFHRIFLEKIEPQLEEKKFYIVENYPPTLSALAKINKVGWAERLELYYGSIEIANAYHELCDWQEYQRCFEKINKERKRDGKEEISVDQDFLSIMKKGLPPSAGIALGLERLYMAKKNLRDINEAIYFSHYL